MKNLSKLILIAFGTLSATSCSENNSIKKVIDLQAQEKQAVIAMSGHFHALIRQKTTLNFVKTCMQQSDKASFMMDFLSPNFNDEQKEIAKYIVGHLFENKSNQDLSAKTEENNFFSLSPTVNLLANKLSGDLKNVIRNAFDDGKSTDQLTVDLKSVILNFKTEVQENTSLTFDEARALIGFSEFQNESIAEIVNMAIALHSNTGGRTQSWLSDMVAVVLTAVTTALVVISVVAVSGGIALIIGGVVAATVPVWFSTAVVVGAIVGTVYGGAVGYHKSANQNSYWTDFNPGNIQGGFLDWEHCSTNLTHWACL